MYLAMRCHGKRNVSIKLLVVIQGTAAFRGKIGFLVNMYWNFQKKQSVIFFSKYRASWWIEIHVQSIFWKNILPKQAGHRQFPCFVLRVRLLPILPVTGRLPVAGRFLKKKLEVKKNRKKTACQTACLLPACDRQRCLQSLFAFLIKFGIQKCFLGFKNQDFS